MKLITAHLGPQSVKTCSHVANLTHLATRTEDHLANLATRTAE